jgi:AcrR family transcriptional regulator
MVSGMGGPNELVREPKQERSRQSFDRVVDAAVALLVERRSGSFTLAEVAARSGVSTGSIYARVASKDDLIRAAHAREMRRLSEETTKAFAADADGATVPEVVAHAVGVLAELLRRHASVLAPFMVIAHDDPVVGAGGKRAYDEMTAAFGALVLTAAPAIEHPDPGRAVAWSCTVAYSVLARQLGLGSDPGAAADYDYEVAVTNLASMITAYLGGAAA